MAPGKVPDIQVKITEYWAAAPACARPAQGGDVQAGKGKQAVDPDN